MVVVRQKPKCLEERVAAIERRDIRVETDKAWETSWTRKIILATFTFLAIGIYLNSIGVTNPWLNAIVPALAFMLSTLTLSWFKKIWLKLKFRKGFRSQ